MVEAMISGQISEADAKNMLQKSKTREQKKQKREALPDWGIKKTRSELLKVDATKTRKEVEGVRTETKVNRSRASARDMRRGSKRFTKPILEQSQKPPADSSFDLEPATTEGTFKYGPHNPLLERDDNPEDSLPSQFPKLSSLSSRSERRHGPPRENRANTTPGVIEGLEADFDDEPRSYIKFDEIFDQTSEEPSHKQQREVSNDEDSQAVSRRELRARRMQNSMPRGFGKLLHDQPIGIAALGQPTSAIVINNPNQMRPERRPSTEIEEKSLEENMRLDWESFMAMNTSDKAESTDEVFQNIEELRPKETRVLRMRDFEKLTNTLLAGFTSIQLRDYYGGHKFDVGAEDEDVVSYDWIDKQISWAPIKGLPSDLQTQKQGYAQRIIFQKWNIAIQEYVDDLGRAHVWIRPELFPLITQGANPVLETLRQDFLVETNNESLTTTSSQCRINITARKPSTYAMLDRLNEILSTLKRQKIQITRHASHEQLKELGRITNTSLKTFSATRSEVEVLWLSRLSPGQEHHETPADIIYRLLTHRPKRVFGPRNHTLQSIPPLEGECDSKAYFADFHRDTKSMDWRDKLCKWFRYMRPVAKDPESQENSLHLSETEALPEAPATAKLARNLTTATFGHILHSAPRKDWKVHHRIFCPVIPHPASFSALKADNDKPLVQSTAIILNFAQHHRAPRGPNRAHRGPSIQLRLPVNADADLSKFSLPTDATLNAVSQWQTDDVMLQTQSVDVRLAQQRLHPLDLDQPQLKDFLAKSEFNLLEGRLRTPSQGTFSIPVKLLNDHGCLGRVGKKTQDLPYIFYGLEIHQTVEMAWRGHTLRYSSIEAGLHGGQRQELTLQVGGHPSAAAFGGEDRASFLQCVEDIATGKVFSWDEGYKAMKERQYEDYSYDLPEEALEDDLAVPELEREESHEVDYARTQEEESDELDFAREKNPDEPDVVKVKEESLDDLLAEEDDNLDDDDILLTKEEEEEMEKEINALLNLAKTSKDSLSKTDNSDPFAVLEGTRKNDQETVQNDTKSKVRSPSPEDESRTKAMDDLLSTIEKALGPKDNIQEKTSAAQDPVSPDTKQDEAGLESPKDDLPKTEQSELGEVTATADEVEEKDKK
ncbi:Fc.00g041530.m01.CDS01 [Cosmosporella sp. VM-42]